MFKRSNTLAIAVLGVVFLGVAFAGTAQADPQVSFTVSPQRAVVGEPITVTDTTSNPEGHELTYEWAKTGFPYDVQAGSPECLNAECSQAQWSYSSPGTYEVTQLVNWPGGEGGSYQRVTVVSAIEAPAPIILNGPTTVSLPTVLDVMSPKQRLINGGCAQPALHGSEWEFCHQYLIKRVGPDPNGFYHYRLRLPMAYPGTVELTFVAWNQDPKQADVQTFTITVTGNAYRFGDVRSCYWPKLRRLDGGLKQRGIRPIRHVYDLHYYAAINSRVVAKLQARQGKRWVTKKATREQFALNKRDLSPWTRRSIQAHFGPKQRLDRKDWRAIYEIRKGRKLLKRGHLSKRRCTKPVWARD